MVIFTNVNWLGVILIIILIVWAIWALGGLLLGWIWIALVFLFKVALWIVGIIVAIAIIKAIFSGNSDDK
jgi:hypothetical protein